MTNFNSIAPVFGVACISAVCCCTTGVEAKDPFAHWESAIQQFEVADTRNPPPENAILFVGSSSIRRWDIQKYFPDLQTINRGFGGSEIEDSTHFAERIIVKHSPKIVVLYAGDNDIAAGKSAEKVYADFQAFVSKVHGSLPKTKIVFISIKPCVARWKFAETNLQANTLIAAECEKDELLEYVDVWEAMLAGQEGPPPANLFASDGLHLSKKGYRLWMARLRPYLE